MNLTSMQRPADIRAALGKQRIAVVGLSSNELRASHFVGYYLKRHGYDVVPVNPRETEVLGLKSYASLRDIPGQVDVVDVFRDPSALPEIVEDTIAIGAPFLWMQFGVIHEQAIARAQSAGITCIVDLCIKIEHARYLGDMHKLGFNTGQISAKPRTHG